MSNERVLHILNDLNDETEEFQGSFIQLDKQSICNAGKIFSSFLLDPTKDSKTRNTYLEYIRLLCCGFNKHNVINNINFETFLDTANIKNIIECPKERENFNTNISFYNELLSFYDRQLYAHELKQQQHDNINEWDQKSFGDFDFTVSKKLDNFIEGKQLLLTLMPVDDTIDIAMDSSSTFADINKRESLIKLGFAVINLKSKNREAIVNDIVMSLSEQTDLKKFEIDFVNHLMQLDEFRSQDLFNKFPFTYEVLIIGLGTDLLKVVDICDSTKLKTMRRFCDISNSCKQKMKNVCYELFALSNYDKRILTLLQEIVQKDEKEYFWSKDFKRSTVHEKAVQNSQKEYGWSP